MRGQGNVCVGVVGRRLRDAGCAVVCFSLIVVDVSGKEARAPIYAKLSSMAGAPTRSGWSPVAFPQPQLEDPPSTLVCHTSTTTSVPVPAQ